MDVKLVVLVSTF